MEEVLQNIKLTIEKIPRTDYDQFRGIVNRLADHSIKKGTITESDKIRLISGLLSIWMALRENK